MLLITVLTLMFFLVFYLAGAQEIQTRKKLPYEKIPITISIEQLKINDLQMNSDLVNKVIIPENYSGLKYLLLNNSINENTTKIKLHLINEDPFRPAKGPIKPGIMNPISFFYEYYKVSSRLERNRKRIYKSYMITR